MERKLIMDPVSAALWREFDTYPVFPPPSVLEVLKSVGVTEDDAERVLSRGIKLTGVSLDKTLFLHDVLDGSPAARFHELNQTELDVSDELKRERWEEFFREALWDADDDHFRAQWPELF